METATREMTFLLAEPERRVLRWIAGRLPLVVRPNHLTGLGVLAAAGTAIGYAASQWHPGWLWLASGMLVLNWFGDSLDGTLARVRAIERPKYGYYLDHMVDAFNTAVIGVGIGLSPYVALPLALGLVIVYLVLSVNVYLESSVFRVFRIGYGRVGPTEVRLLLVLANAALFSLAVAPTGTVEVVSGVTNWAVALLGTGMLGTLAVRFGSNLTRLARVEPQVRS